MHDHGGVYAASTSSELEGVSSASPPPAMPSWVGRSLNSNSCSPRTPTRRKHSDRVEEQSQGTLPSETVLTTDEKKALSCVNEMLSVIGGVAESSKVGGCVQEEDHSKRMTTSVVTPTPPVKVSSPPQLTPLAPNPSRTPSPSTQRRSLFNLSKYQPLEHSDCPGETSHFKMQPMSIVPKIDNAKPSTRRLLLRSSSHSAPDLRSPQPTKSLLKKKQQQFDLDSSDSSSSSTGSNGIKRSTSNVSFSNLEIREYNVALSDHPDCSFGPPIQLGWEYSAQELVSVDDYEEHRSPRRRNLVHDPYRRSCLLNEAGYTDQELQSAMEDVHRAKQERLQIRGQLHKNHRRQQHRQPSNMFDAVLHHFFYDSKRRSMSQ